LNRRPLSGRTLRLFDGDEALVRELERDDDPSDPRWNFVVARVLEEGDGGDLRWLFSRCPETVVRDWFERHAGRALSRRSRWFWSRILSASAASDAPLAARLLWPLA
jgi:hypothetical protein